MRNVACRLMSIERAQRSGGSSTNGRSSSATPVCIMPALLTSTSTGPAASANPRACSHSVRSATNPSAPSSAARAWMRSVVELISTRAPRSTSVLAAAKPIPSALPAPVTRARLPVSETDTARHANYSGAAMLVLKALAVLGALIIAAVVGRVVLGPEVKMYRVPSEAMVPTIQVGDRVVGNFAAYDDDAPKVGDIVIVHPPAGAESDSMCAVQPEAGGMCAKPTSEIADVNFIKRVVGLPGDKLSLKAGRVVRNGRPLDEPYAAPCQGESCDFPKPITVPAGHYFTLGDNRGSSDDSRFWGPVPLKAVIARVDDCAPLIRLFCHAKT